MTVDSEKELHELKESLEKKTSNKVFAFREPDIGGSITAIAIADYYNCYSDHFKHLKLGNLKQGKIMTNQVFKSRWGFHPCSVSTYRKLKLLNRYAYMALSRIAAHKRWKAKDPKNRRKAIFVKVIDTNDNRKISQRKSDRKYEIIPEPVLPPVDFDVLSIIISDTTKARIPATDESKVQKLTLSEFRIDELISQLSEWAVSVHFQDKTVAV